MRQWVKIVLVLACLSKFLNASFLENERNIASKEKKLILLTVKSDFCPYCIKMKKDIFDVKKYSDKINKQYVHVYIDRDDSILPSYLHVKYVPTNFILSARELKILDEFPGYTEAEHFLELLDMVYVEEVK